MVPHTKKFIKSPHPRPHPPPPSKVIEINKPRGDLIIMEQINCHITTLISLLAVTTKSQRYGSNFAK